jgi:hypothetical protein
MSIESRPETTKPIDVVPLEWPAMCTAAPTPVRAIRGLPALPAMLLLWFAPKRIGPFVAAAGWHAAIMASLIGMGLGLGLFASRIDSRREWTVDNVRYIAYEFNSPKSEQTLAEAPRVPLAALVLLAYSDASNRDSASVLPLILAAIPLGLLSLAVLLMPLAAAGERLTLLVGRCLRLTLWSTTTLIPLGVAMQWWPWGLDYFAPPYSSGLRPSDNPVGDFCNRIMVIALLAFALWWLFVLWRSGLRYAGPADGPAWRARTPRCGNCGYNIATLRVDARCPECNQLVADSVARLQRKTKPTRWRLFVASLREAMRFGEN